MNKQVLVNEVCVKSVLKQLSRREQTYTFLHRFKQEILPCLFARRHYYGGILHCIRSQLFLAKQKKNDFVGLTAGSLTLIRSKV